MELSWQHTCTDFAPALLWHLPPPSSVPMTRSGWKTTGESTSPEPQGQPWAPPAPLSCSLPFTQSQTKPEESICQLGLDPHLGSICQAPAAALDRHSSAFPARRKCELRKWIFFIQSGSCSGFVLTAGTEVTSVHQGLIWALLQPEVVFLRLRIIHLLS